MKNRLGCIMLIDDNDADNFLHEMVVAEYGQVDEVISMSMATDALSYLRNHIEDDLRYPDIIFLDINMPRMNGWEFLEEYQKIFKHAPKKTSIVMLSGSVNPDDRTRALNIPEVDAFCQKPLDTSILSAAIVQYLETYAEKVHVSVGEIKMG